MDLPARIQIVEVGPRDGFQNITAWIPTELKLEVIDCLLEANIKKIEITSFVHPKAIPQMQDAEEIVAAVLKKNANLDIMALAPNLTGAKAAWKAGIKLVTYVISASERHNMENVRRTITESLTELNMIKQQLPELKIKLAIATAFGCPFEKTVPVDQVLRMIEAGLARKTDEICLCDTIGIANPGQMDSVLSVVKKVYPDQDFSLHLHDTRGMGLANILVALDHGITVFETAVGGLGGCPFAPGAAGNIASEDLVFMLEEMGIKTGIQLSVLLKAAALVKKTINPNLTGHMVHVCSP